MQTIPNPLQELFKIINEIELEVKAIDKANLALEMWKTKYSFASPEGKNKLFKELLEQTGLDPKDFQSPS